MLAVVKRLLPIFLLIIFQLFSGVASADSKLNTSIYLVAGPQAEIGDILVSNETGMVKASEPYSTQIFGVVQQLPDTYVGSSQGLQIAQTGVAEINVTTINGVIKKGDYITSSTIPGKGEKASKSGSVVGAALEDFGDPNAQTTTEGQIRATLKIGYVGVNTSGPTQILDSLNSLLVKSLQEPQKAAQVVRFTFAGVVAALVLSISYLVFSKSLVKAIEAVGRNPLARRSILMSLFINVLCLVVMLLIGGGLVLALIKL
jgi:hypothetical protein